MRVILDVEGDAIEHPKNIWCCVTKDIDTLEERIFRPYKDGPEEFIAFIKSATLVSGHHILGYDIPALCEVLGYTIPYSVVVDTLICSRLIFNLRDKHSLKSWGETFGIKKEHSDEGQDFFQQWSQELEDRCISDVRINLELYNRLSSYINSPLWAKSLRSEHFVGTQCLKLHQNGFGFAKEEALRLLSELRMDVADLDLDIQRAFPPRLKLIRVITPKETQHGTIHRGDFRWQDDGDLSAYSVGASFSHCKWEEFNAGSPSQIVSRLNEAGWRPTERTDGYNKALRSRDRDKLDKFHRTNTGWKCSEENLKTLPPSAPEGARKLAKRIMLQSRVSDLEEWLALARPDGQGEWRIHGFFNGIGAWTQRLSHNKPNTANIPTRKPQDPEDIAALNDRVRKLWVSPKGRLLVGVDADQIQLRVLAHYMQDQIFIDALVNGVKELHTDVHSLNVAAIGPACQGRRDAKTFIYSWLLGAGVGRIAEILGCSQLEGKDARERFVSYYPGLKRLKSRDIARDASRGYFQGLDGRYVRIFGEDEDQRNHFCLGGYLQNGEKVVMAHAMAWWVPKLDKERVPYKLVNWVHDEWQVEVPDDRHIAEYVSRTLADSIGIAGASLELRCPMKGSINGGHDKIAIGRNWLETH